MTDGDAYQPYRPQTDDYIIMVRIIVTMMVVLTISATTYNKYKIPRDDYIVMM